MYKIVRVRSWVGLLVCSALQGEQGVLVLHIKDLHDHPIQNVRLRAGDTSISAPTNSQARQHRSSAAEPTAVDSYGEARIRLGSQTKPGDVVLLEIVGYPNDKDLVFISPWEKWTHVPPFENEAKNLVAVTLGERGDRACLENDNCIRATASQINKDTAPKTPGDRSSQRPSTQEALSAVAKQFGLAPNEVDQAIRAWGERTEDPYDKGLAALYEERLPEASLQLQKALPARKRAESDDRDKTADAAFFLGRSLYQQGKYRQAAEAYEEGRSRRPDDARLLNGLGLSWSGIGEYGKAELLYRQALDIKEKTLGPSHPDVATILNNLAELLRDKGEDAEAEPLLRSALAIDEKALGPDHPDVARELNNLAELLRSKGDYVGAEPLLRRALAINENVLGPYDPEVATIFVNLAQLSEERKDYASAELLLRKALAIDEKALGLSHPEVARILNNLALLLQARGDYTGAEPLFRRALAIAQRVLPLDHPEVAANLYNFATFLTARGNYSEAEPLYQRALMINEKKLGPDHPTTRMIREHLQSLRSYRNRRFY